MSYVKKHKPANWQVQLCNRRASFRRRTGRIDWISYYHCIRSPKIAGAVVFADPPLKRWISQIDGGDRKNSLTISDRFFRGPERG